MSSETLVYLIPEMALVATAMVIYLAGAFFPASRGAWGWVATAGIVLAALALASAGQRSEILGPLVGDRFSLFGRWLALVLGMLLLMVTSRAAATSQAAEYVGTLLLTVVGTMLVAGAADLVLVFVGLELISIPTFVLLYLGRRDAASQESTAKYFFLSVLSSAILLYGFSFLYGAGGSTRLDEIYARIVSTGVASSGEDRIAALALVLIVAGLAFKIAAVPFHFYAPDVYEGTSHGNAALLAALPKIAGLLVLVRIVAAAMPTEAQLAWKLVLLLAVLTMTLGNVLALWQDNLRRLLAYSSIAHAGYMLIGVTVALAVAAEEGTSGLFDGTSAMLIYLALYAVASTGTFAGLAYLGRAEQQLDVVDELAGVGRSHPVTALAIAVFMFSLAGVPILGGFWGKLALFSGAVGFEPSEDGHWTQLWLVALAIVGAINAAIAAAYYLRLVAVMYFRTSRSVPRGEGGAGAAIASFVCAVALVAIGVYPAPLIRAANAASVAARTTLVESASKRTAGEQVAVETARPASREAERLVE